MYSSSIDARHADAVLGFRGSTRIRLPPKSLSLFDLFEGVPVCVNVGCFDTQKGIGYSEAVCGQKLVATHHDNDCVGSMGDSKASAG